MPPASSDANKHYLSSSPLRERDDNARKDSHSEPNVPDHPLDALHIRSEVEAISCLFGGALIGRVTLTSSNDNPFREQHLF